MIWISYIVFQKQSRFKNHIRVFWRQMTEVCADVPVVTNFMRVHTIRRRVSRPWLLRSMDMVTSLRIPIVHMYQLYMMWLFISRAMPTIENQVVN